MKKLISLALVLVMVLSMAAVVSADDPTGSITINGVSTDTEYAIYKLLDLESFNKDSGAYSYKANPAWNGFFATDEAKTYITFDASGYATWTTAEDDATVAAFAKLALAFAKANSIAPVKSSKNAGEFVITGDAGKFSDLTLGYYLVDSSAGALCGLTTTDLNASINAKNHVPTIDKQVYEDGTGLPGDTNTADIGQIVEFVTAITVAPGAENYVLHDKMSEGLTFVQDLTTDPENPRGVWEISRKIGDNAPTVLTEGSEYTIKTDDLCSENCTFEVVFSKAFVESLNTNDRILVKYNAMLNRNAVIAGTGNSNESWLEYGEDHNTTHDSTTTYTFSIDIVKTDSSNTLIDGAAFRIYDAAVGGNEIKVVPLMDANDENVMKDSNGNPIYRRARADEDGVDIVVKDGKVTVVGFDNGEYYLEEVIAPAGYNKLTSRTQFNISNGNLDSVFNGPIYSTGSGVHVVNKTGNMLPETGATGTMLFIGFGMIVMIGTGLLLVTKKRMSMIQD